MNCLHDFHGKYQRAQNLPKTFRVVDRHDATVGGVTSIKSRDLRAKTYQDPAKLAATIRRDIDKVASFTQGQLGDVRLELGVNFTERGLQVAVPQSVCDVQWNVLEQMGIYAQQKGIQFDITVVT